MRPAPIEAGRESNAGRLDAHRGARQPGSQEIDTHGDCQRRTKACRLLYQGLEPLNATQHGKMKVRRTRPAPQRRQDPRDAGDGRRVRAGPAPLSDRLLGRRESGAAGADGPQRGRQRLPRRGRPAARRANVYIPAYMRRYPFLLARLRPDSDELSLCFDPTLGRGRRVRRRRGAVRRRPAERGDQGDPPVLRAVRDRRPAHRRRSWRSSRSPAC